MKFLNKIECFKSLKTKKNIKTIKRLMMPQTTLSNFNYFLLFRTFWATTT